MNSLLDIFVARKPSDVIRNATLERINHFLLSPKDVHVYSDLRRLCTTVSVSYRNRSVLELLQNAHDAHDVEELGGRVRFYLADEGEFGALYAANDGRGFSEDNFTALCSPTRTTKAMNEAIGNKGVGFLSVFQICSHPEVYSRIRPTSSADFDGFCFAFADHARLGAFLDFEGLGASAKHIAESMPQLYLVTPLDEPSEVVKALGVEGYSTVMRMPLKNAEARLAVEAQLRDLVAGDADVQLFLDRISELKIEIDGYTHLLDRHVEQLALQNRIQLQRVTCGARSYVVARRSLCEADVRAVINADVASEALPESWTDWRGDAVVSLAVTANGEPLKGRVYTFLPMGKDVEAPLSGHLDAPFFATIERKNVEEGGSLNPYLFAQCRVLALEASALVKSVLPDEQARHVVADLLMWTGPEAASIRQALWDEEAVLIPAECRRGTASWSDLKAVRAWEHSGFFTAQRAAAFATFPLIDTNLGPARIARLKSFVGNASSLAVTAAQKADVIVAIAQELFGRNSPIAEWDRFYAALPELLPGSSGALLQGRPILLTERMELVAAEGSATKETSRARRRLSTVFLPPLRNSSTPLELPLTVQRRMTYLHGKLACVGDGANPGRKFLTGANLVREYDRREVLRVIAGVIADPGHAKDPEQARWDALRAILTICTEDGGALADAAEINVRLPTRSGWHRAADTFFGGWPGTHSDELDELFEKAGPVSQELHDLGELRLKPCEEWQVPPGRREAWIKFLTLAGVRDHLRPLPAIPGQPVRHNGNWLVQALSARNLVISAEQKNAWISQLSQQDTLTNPNTEFSVKDAFRFPGQANYAEIAKVAAELYAVQIVRMLEEVPSLVSMTVFRPNHPHAPNACQWPSPAATFLVTEEWVPIVGKTRERLGRSWLPASNETSPMQASLVSHQTKAAIERSDRARNALIGMGLSVFGQSASAWPLIVQAGPWLASSSQSGDRLWSLTQDAWARANLERSLPAGIRLLAKSDGEIIAFDPRTETRTIYLADGDDRTMVAALSRAAPGVIIFEPPLAKSQEVAGYLSAQLPGRLRRMSEMELVYKTPEEPFVFDSSNPFIESEIAGDLRSFALLTVRYKCRFVTASPDRVLGKLSALRICWADELKLQFGSHQLEVPAFQHSAVLVSSDQGDTLLAPRSAKGTDRELMVLSSSLGEAIASRALASDAFYATASRMVQTGLGLTSQGLADALGLSQDDVLAAMQDTRSVIAALVHVARPFIGMWSDGPVLEALADRQWSTEAEMVTALDELKDKPVSGGRLIEACRTGSVEAAAIELEVDLAALNSVLIKLGPPYRPIDRTSHHKEGFAAHLIRHEGKIRESLRSGFRSRFEDGDLSQYVAARNWPAPTIPQDAGSTQLRSTPADWASWLTAWFNRIGIRELNVLPLHKQSLETVRDQNVKLLRAMAPTARLILIGKLGADAEAVRFWRDPDGLEGRLTALANAGGWIDFDFLDEAGMLRWLARSGHWPAGWPQSFMLSDHDLLMDDIEALKVAERKARELILNPPRILQYSGGSFIVGQTGLATVTQQINDLAESNSGLMASSTRTAHGVAPISEPRGGGGGGGSSGHGNFASRMTDDEKKIIGYFGEAIAFAWLKEKFGRNRVVDYKCWKSEYRFHACGETGDDLLGYDFEIQSGRATWFFEVKSTSIADQGGLRMIELGSTEIAKAEVCRAENRSHYRILRITDALRPERATLTVLPNPRSDEGLKFYSEQKSAGVRLHFRT